jgi:hypothetical protein
LTLDTVEDADEPKRPVDPGGIVRTRGDSRDDQLTYRERIGPVDVRGKGVELVDPTKW